MTDSPAMKALRYAENELGVNSVYEKAQQFRQSLDNLLDDLSTARDQRREIEAKIEARELDIISDERGKHPEMSQAAMDRHLKVAFHKEDDLLQLRSILRETIGTIEGFEYDRVVLETDIKIAVARMQELGGYLQYLAVIKSKSGSE